MTSTDVSPRLPGEEGLWVFVLGDLIVFSLFFATYLFYRDVALAEFSQAQSKLSLSIGTTNTIVLLTSSYVVVNGIRALRAGRTIAARRMLGLTALLGSIFIAGKLGEYLSIVKTGYPPHESQFFMFYFVFTGIHLIHVGLGLVALSVLAFLTRSDSRSEGTTTAAECGAVYWHMVDLLWIVLFTLFYLLP